MSIPWHGRRAYYTRSFVQSFPVGHHPWLGVPLPLSPRSQPRGPAEVGHQGPQVDAPEDADDDVASLDLGEAEQPAYNTATHVRSVAGGYVHILSKEEWERRNSKEEKEKRRKERQRKERRKGVLGADKRRRKWRKGAGSQRRRDARGRFVRDGGVDA